MRIGRVIFQNATLLLLAALGMPLLAAAQVSVVTQSYDTGRTGQNLEETILNATTVNVTSFGRLFSQPVDGYIYGQPLYLPNVTINGQVHNVVYVTTQHNSVYAFDADDNTGGNANPLWHVNLGPPVPTDDICPASGQPSGCYTDIMPYIGITAAPVIDPSSGTMYLVAKNKRGSSSYAFALHALDVTNGAEKFGGPVDIMASGFDPFPHLNRPGLLLLGGNVYTAFGSAGDFLNWHGWVMAYDAQTLAQVAVLNTTPKPASGSSTAGGGIWGGGKGLLTDGTYIYVATSNGYNDLFNAGSAYTSSFLKLTTPNLTVNDYYAPSNQYYLNTSPGNVDIGSGGPIALPGTSPLEIVGGGKDGILRVMDTTHMGGYSSTNDNDLQNFQATLCYTCGAAGGMIMGGPIFWNNPTLGPAIYLWGPSDYIKAWQLSGKTFNTTPVSKGTILNSTGISNLAAMSLSANGSQSGTGIVWASRAYSGEANYPSEPGILTAFDAEDLTKELWDSRMNSARDDAGEYAKFNPPTVANGKVYLAGFVGPAQVGKDSGQLLVYGLLTPPDFTLTASALSPATVTPGASDTSTITIAPVNGFTGAVALTCSGLPTGANCAFNPTPVANGSGNSALTISTAASTPVGTYAVTVGGTSGSLSHTAQLSLVVQASTGGSFTLKATPTAISVAAGSSGTSTITVTPVSGFNGAVALTCSGFPAGASCTFNPSSVANGSGTSTLTINTTSSTLTGSYTVTVTGTSGSLTQTTSVNLTVQAQTTGSFTLSATPLVPSAVSAGASATSTVTVSGSGGFNSTVNLSCKVNTTASPAPICSLNPASASSGSSSTLTINTIAAHASLAGSRSVFYAMLLPIGGFALLGAGFTSRRKRLLGLLLLCLAVSGLLLLASCGGGSSSSGGGGNGGTPTGTYTVVVTGTSGSLSPQTVTVSLTVQ